MSTRQPWELCDKDARRIVTHYVCIHGHFYQPPRENPWLEAIEPQDSAAPYHDWNERITQECYEPNTASRILDDDGRIVSIVNNYGRISFDFGPTLLSWLERERPSVYEAVLNADRESRSRFGGHGSALAQAYNHVILPLATPESIELQVVWGLRDFEHRFERKAEGMWLPETAVNLETLEVLVAHGVQYTILAPSQAARTRPLGATDWRDVSRWRIDTTTPYLQRLPSGASIAVFFYDGALSRGVAFEGLLHRGEDFARQLATVGAGEGSNRDVLVHIATDGESYGHHHPHGDMALAYALRVLEERGWGKVTNYGEYLEDHPPSHEVEIIENTSWSCPHGVERWRSDCGCRTGGPRTWTQEWRAPLRAALDWLRDRAAESARESAERLFDDGSKARHAYIDVILDRSDDSVERFLRAHRKGLRNETNDVLSLELMELERQLQLMYTSCGWFFNDLAGIETIQVLQYAGRALQLLENVGGANLEDGFLRRLAKAHSNRVESGSGRDIYQRRVQPAKLTWEMLGAHYAMATFFEAYPETTTLYCYDVTRELYRAHEKGQARLALGRARLFSRITRAHEVVSFAVMYLGDQRVTTGVQRGARLCDALEKPFRQGRHDEVLGLIDQCFGEHQFRLESLFGDEQRRIIDALLRSTLEDAETSLESLFENHRSTMKFLVELGVPAPAALSLAAEVVLNGKLRRALSGKIWNSGHIGELLSEAVTDGIRLDEDSLAFTARQTLERLAEQFFSTPSDRVHLERLLNAVRVAVQMPFEIELWRVQNLYFRCCRRDRFRLDRSERWRRAFEELGEELSIRLPSQETEVGS